MLEGRLRVDLSVSGRRSLNKQRCDCCGIGLLEPRMGRDGSLALVFAGARLQLTWEQYCPPCWRTFRAARSQNLLIALWAALSSDSRVLVLELGFPDMATARETLTRAERLAAIWRDRQKPL